MLMSGVSFRAMFVALGILYGGEATAMMLGRLTLNPIPHVDPVGSILVPALLALSGTGLLLGWAKPVPVNPRNFRSYKRGDILVSLAGIASNLVLAVLFTLLLAAALFAVGVLRIIAGFDARPAAGWGWMVAAGVFTVLFGGSKPFEPMLDLVSELGVEAVEIGTGAYPGNAYCRPGELLESDAPLSLVKRSDWKK